MREYICRLFNEGWKPALGWVCVAAIAWRYIGITMTEVCFHIVGMADVVMTRSDATHVFALVTALLGMGGLHSYDKRHTQKDEQQEVGVKK